MPALSSSAPGSRAPLPAVFDLLCGSGSPASAVAVNPPCGASLHPISNEHFQGRLMLKMRPSDSQQRKASTAQQPSDHHQLPDDKAVPGSSAAAATDAAGAGAGSGSVCDASGGACDCCSAFFAAHPSVQLELAVQGRFLRPVSRVWMGAELGGSTPAFTLPLPFLKRTLIKVMAGIIATLIPNVKWTLGDKAAGESPLIAFPLVSAMDCVLSTPLSSADAAPPLSWTRLPAMDGSHRSSMSFDSELSPSQLYSLGFYSDQLDLARWKAVSVPGVSEIDLQSVWLGHPLTLLAYSLIDQHGPHSAANRRTLFAVQVQPPAAVGAAAELRR